MEKIQFKCELLSDIVLSDSSATEGKRRSLDFIPGNNFLGIAAARIYHETNEHTWLLFHSGHVRFGDAHPSIDGRRGLRIPASLFYPKLKSVEEECYVHHHLKQDEAIRNMQPKQCREGFYVFDGENVATKVAVDKDFAIKSAYDSDKRRAKDEQMFGYEALCKGLTLYFSVELDDEAVSCKQEITEALCGSHHVGRSRSAQYGKIRISETAYQEAAIGNQPICIGNGKYIEVYADSRLVFFDGNGNSTFQPTPADLGIAAPDATIDWKLSQIRTFQYAPWNYRRQAFDADRCGIEKGSVFIVKTTATVPERTTIGQYRNEGFGCVIYNPAFLQANERGISVLLFKKEKKEVPTTSDYQPANTPLIAYLRKKKEERKDESSIISLVNKFVENNRGIFSQELFASQWGSIRSLAMVYDEGQLPNMIERYLNHGVASDKWEERGRKAALNTFMKEKEVQGHLQEAIINLASEMAKICKQKEK